MQPSRIRLNRFLISLIGITRRVLEWIEFLVRQRVTIYFITVGVAVYGALPRFWGLSRSLWLDESWVANSLIADSLYGMFYYGSWLQTSPPLFLLLARIPVGLFGLSNTVLRAFPLFMGILAALSMFLLARRILSRQFALLAWVLFVLSPVAISYSRVLKQYSSELAASASILLVCTLYFEKPTGKRFWLLMGTVIIGLLIAYGIAFVVPGIVLAICVSPNCFATPSNSKALTSRNFLRAFLLTVVAGGILICEYFLFVAPNSPAVLHAFWTKNNAKGLSFPRLVASESYELIGDLPLNHHLRREWIIYVVGVLLILGVSLAWLRLRRGRPKWLQIQVICMLPCVLLIISDSLSLYPFTDRTSLFALPFVIVLVISSVQLASFLALKKLRARFRSIWNVGLLTAVIITIIAGRYNNESLARSKVPWEEMDGAVSFLKEHVQPQDFLWVHASSSEGFKLYAKMRSWRDAPAKYGHTGWPCCARGVTDYTSNESLVRADLATVIPSFNGRIWLLYTNRQSHWQFVGLDEPRIVKGLLVEKGCVESSSPVFQGVGVSSFDCKF